VIHKLCGTYFKDVSYRCPHCGLIWCPRCRELFAPDEPPKEG
jgi:predicted RNA-binding Zn-ribbon protein involved in translation (DUF1610 family)